MKPITTTPPIEAPIAPAAAPPREVELKLWVPAASIERLWSHPLLLGESGAAPGLAHSPRPHVARIDNRYFDTPDRALAERRMALRLRRIGRRWLQTLKVADADAGALSARDEWEMPVAGPALELGRLRATPLLQIASQRVLASRLAPVFTTNFRRESRLLRLKDGSVIECAFDRGIIVAGRGRTRRSLPICELELEVKEGAPDLLKFAARLVRDIALVPLAASKAERGHRLAQGLANEPVRAVLPVPQATDRASHHLARVLAACNRALLANVHALLEVPSSADADVEFVHQARVAVRRMRSALRTFEGIVDRRRVDALDVQLTTVGKMLGDARDLDILTTTTMKRLRDEVGSDDAGRAALAAIQFDTEAQRQGAHAALTTYLAHGGFGAAAIAVDRLVVRLLAETGHGATLAERAPAWLASQRERLIRRSRRIAVLDAEQRHGLRVEVKRLRYALDLLDGLYDAARVKPFHDALADLQDKLGRLNDAVVADTLLRAMPDGDGVALVRERFGLWLARHVRRQLPKVAALSVEFELTAVPWDGQ
jgi:inorganic triphosphatase YgiF